MDPTDPDPQHCMYIAIGDAELGWRGHKWLAVRNPYKQGIKIILENRREAAKANNDDFYLFHVYGMIMSERASSSKQ